MGWSYLLYPFKLLFVYPLKLFYQHGPVWKGMPVPDVCAQLTNIPASFWYNQTDMCESRFEREFNSFGITIGVTMYFLLVFTLIVYSLCQCCFVRPLVSGLQKNIKALVKHDVPSCNRHCCSHSHGSCPDVSETSSDV